MTDHLNDLRATINWLDDEILALVRRRMTLASDIIAAKQGHSAYPVSYTHLTLPTILLV